jgi:predicted carbohydrate-binding protein with CBM5 and CBM33 domain
VQTPQKQRQSTKPKRLSKTLELLDKMMTRLETTLETRLENSKDTKGRTAKKATKLFWVASFAAKINQNLQLNNSSFQDFTIKVTNYNEHNCCLFHKEKSERGCCEREREKRNP